MLNFICDLVYIAVCLHEALFKNYYTFFYVFFSCNSFNFAFENKSLFMKFYPVLNGVELIFSWYIVQSPVNSINQFFFFRLDKKINMSSPLVLVFKYFIFMQNDILVLSAQYSQNCYGASYLNFWKIEQHT